MPKRDGTVSPGLGDLSVIDMMPLTILQMIVEYLYCIARIEWWDRVKWLPTCILSNPDFKPTCDFKSICRAMRGCPPLSIERFVISTALQAQLIICAVPEYIFESIVLSTFAAVQGMRQSTGKAVFPHLTIYCDGPKTNLCSIGDRFGTDTLCVSFGPQHGNKQLPSFKGYSELLNLTLILSFYLGPNLDTLSLLQGLNLLELHGCPFVDLAVVDLLPLLKKLTLKECNKELEKFVPANTNLEIEWIERVIVRSTLTTPIE